MRLPDFAASDATREFNTDLYQEHLEEASFLYEQRLSLYDDPEMTWVDIGEVEERLEAHIDALVLGTDLALEVCQRRAEEGEPGELYAAVCVFCRTGRRDLLIAVLKALDPEDAVRPQAVSDAMKDEMPAEWARALVSELVDDDEKLIPIWTNYLGHRRLAAGELFDKFIGRAPAKALARLLWGLSRVGVNGLATHVAGYLDHEDAAVRINAVMALLRRGDGNALAACRERVLRGDRAMCLPLAVSGGRSDAAVLQGAVLTQAITPETLLALGVLGDAGSLPVLVDKLTDKGRAAAAAIALQLITGADLQEEVFIPEDVPEDELFDEELQTYRETGEGPKHSDNRPFGVNVKRIAQNPDSWRNWLEKHSADFDPTQRYRLGKPFSLGSVVETLASPSCSRQVRSLASEELLIRYEIDVAFEAEMRVVEQKRQIHAIAELCRSREASFRPGQWYFAGRLA